MNLATIVEGHGEYEAVPVLLRRMIPLLDPPVTVLRPHRVPRGKLVKREELQRAVELAARKAGAGGAVLILLDANGDCPAELAPRLSGWARGQRGSFPLSVVIAKCEFESWFLASAVSLRGVHGLPADLEPPPEPEAIRSAKEWLGRRMPRGYSETVDQPTLAAKFDLAAAARSAPSFDKLRRDLQRLLGDPPVRATDWRPPGE